IGVAFAPTSGGMKGLNLTIASKLGGAATVMAQGSGRPPSPLNVGRDGSGSGTVTSQPDGIDCGSRCAASYVYGATVTLTATPDASSDFTGWSGACAGTGPCVVMMTEARQVTAS